MLTFPNNYLNIAVHRHFEATVIAHPQQVAVTSKGIALSYAQLNQHANRIAHALVAQLGNQHEPIAIIYDHDLPICAAIWGTLKSGKCYAVISPTHPTQQIEILLADLKPRLILTQTQYIAKVHSLNVAQTTIVINTETLANDLPTHNLNIDTDTQKTLGIFYTSGSTGTPKGVLRSHLMLLQRIHIERSANDDTPPEANTSPKHVSMLQPSHLANSLRGFFDPLLSGDTVCMFNIHASAPKGIAEWLSTERISHLHLPIALFRQFLADLSPSDYFPDIRQIALAGRQYKQDLEQIWQHFPTQTTLISRYSSSETSQITRMLIRHNTPIDSDIVPVGYPMPGYNITLVDENNQAVPQGESGEIIVTSAFISEGYLNQPELTARVFSGDSPNGTTRTYRTGDWGRLRPDGCLEFLGRKDDRVKIRGFTVELAEVEAAVCGVAGVKTAAVIAKDAGMGDKKLLCYWVPTAETQLNNSELRRQVALLLPSHMLPAAFSQLAALPIASTGKIDHRALPDIGNTRPDLPIPFTAPRSNDEAKLADIWAEVLALDTLGIHDSFLDLGGNSLQAMRIISRILREFQVEISQNVLLQKPSIAEMALTITQYRAKRVDVALLEQLLTEL